MRRTCHQSENGNVFFYIFLAVALFAALSFAISQGSRSSMKNLTDERAKLLASEILDYSEIIASAVTQLRLRNIALADIRFSHPDLPAVDYGTYGGADAENEIFNPSGGGIVYHDPANDMVSNDAQQYAFISSTEIQEVGTTCGTANCSDLLIMIEDVELAICLEINNLSGITNPSSNPPEDADIDYTDKFQGTMGYTETIGDEAGSADLAGQTAGCFKATAPDKYYFYQVLLPR